MDLTNVTSVTKRRAIITAVILPYTVFSALKFGWLGLRYGVIGVWSTAAIQWAQRSS